MRHILLFWILTVFSLSACHDPAPTKTNSTQGVPAGDTTNSGAQILNRIIVQEKGGLQVARTFLSYESGRLVSSQNRTALGRPVYLNIIIKKGWAVQNGQVSLGAVQRVETNAGELVVDSMDLFQEMKTIDAQKANYIRLKTRITQTRPDIAYFLIRYRVWDKQGSGEVKGNYKLFIESGRKG